MCHTSKACRVLRLTSLLHIKRKNRIPHSPNEDTDNSHTLHLKPALKYVRETPPHLSHYSHSTGIINLKELFQSEKSAGVLTNRTAMRSGTGVNAVNPQIMAHHLD
jgi:hypothetical protein